MINLEKTSGLPLELNDDFHLKFNPPLAHAQPVIRTFTEVIPVLMDPHARPTPKQEDMYFMYRDVHLPADETAIRAHDLRYDITVVPAGTIGKEFNKTIGHYHPAVPGSKQAYPEMYEVLEGEALFLIQKMDQEFIELISVDAIQAQKGDMVIYPPGFGHVIVNIGKGPLVTGNWVAADFKSIYSSIADRHGMAYYVLLGESQPFVFEKNNHYTNHPQIRMLHMTDKIRDEFGFEPDKPMYTSGVSKPKTLEFLTNPDKYAKELSTITS